MSIIQKIIEFIMSLFGIKSPAQAQQEIDAAKSEAEAAKAHEDSVIAAGKLEAEIIAKQEEIRREEEAKKDDPDDPLGIDDWNKGT